MMFILTLDISDENPEEQIRGRLTEIANNPAAFDCGVRQGDTTGGPVLDSHNNDVGRWEMHHWTPPSPSPYGLD